MNFAFRLLASGMAIAAFGAIAACSSPTTSGSGNDVCDSCDVHPGSGTSSAASSSSAEFPSGDSLALTWISIPAGTWTRSASNTRITQSSFLVSQTEVMQSDYFALMDTLPPQKVVGDSMPVANVSWFEAVLFSNALSKKLGHDSAYSYDSRGLGNTLVNVRIDYAANAVRLPTEAEWEYAIRAGTSTDYYWGTKTALQYAQYGLNGGYKQVAGKTANAWSLYDMAGNVSEWCSDFYGAYATNALATNPTGAAQGVKRVVRGGSWSSSVSALASDARDSAVPDDKRDTRGFRVVLFGE